MSDQHGDTMLVVLSVSLGLFDFSSWDSPKRRTVVSEDLDRVDAASVAGSSFVVAFYSTSCIACRRFRTSYEKAASQLSSKRGVPLFAVNVDSHTDARVKKRIEMYGVTAVPSIYFVHAARRVKYRRPPVAKRIVSFVENDLSQ